MQRAVKDAARDGLRGRNDAGSCSYLRTDLAAQWAVLCNTVLATGRRAPA